jgi:hypothetical protein
VPPPQRFSNRVRAVTTDHRRTRRRTRSWTGIHLHNGEQPRPTYLGDSASPSRSVTERYMTVPHRRRIGAS